MTENFTQAMNMLQVDNTNNDETRSNNHQVDNVRSDNVTNLQLMEFLKSFPNKVDLLERKSLSNIIDISSNTISAINPRTGKPSKRYCYSCGCCSH